jgi:hypothetical protein
LKEFDPMINTKENLLIVEKKIDEKFGNLKQTIPRL